MMPEVKNAIVWRIGKGLEGLIKAARRESLTDNAFAIYALGLAKMSAAVRDGEIPTGPCYDDSPEVSAMAWRDLWWENGRSERHD